MQRQYPSRSRLNRRIEKQSKKALFLSLLGIIVIIFLIFKFGIPLLIRFSLLVADLKDEALPQDKKQSSVLIAPKFSPLPTATNSATMEIHGVTLKNTQIEIFLNNDLVNKLSTDENGNFTIEALRLKDGQNILKARIRENDKVGEFSDEAIITYDTEPPKLDLSQPSDNQIFSKDTKTIIVAGKTEGVSHLTVNGFWAIVDSNGSFSYNLPLSFGDNKIIIEAIDEAGNKTAIERKVTLSQ